LVLPARTNLGPGINTHSPFHQPLSTLHPVFEDGTDRGFRNVGKSQSDAGEIPKKTHTIFKTRRKFEIKGTSCYNVYRAFPGCKAAGPWCSPHTPSSSKVKERVELHLCFPCGPSWPVIGWVLLFFYFVLLPEVLNLRGRKCHYTFFCVWHCH
jgi:hypothetical protein